MRNIKTREGFELWDKLCALPRYAFLLSPSGSTVQKFEDRAMGNWIDVHEAQAIVDQAQDRISELQEEVSRQLQRSNDFASKLSGAQAVSGELQQLLTAADERVDVLEGLLLQTNELLYAIQGDPGAVPSSSIDAMRGEVFTALKPVEAAPAATCTWSESGFSWHTGCGKEWQFTDGGLPAENGMRFCHSCGKTLVAETAESP